MATINEYIDQLKSDKADLKTNLQTKGVTGLTSSDTFTELVPKVLDIESPNLESKTVTITENLVTYISPTSPYNGLSSVEVTTNVVPDYSEMMTSALYPGAAGGNGLGRSFIKVPIAMTPAENVLSYAFYNCNNLVESPTINNTGSVSRCDGMFRGCSELQTVTAFDTSHVGNMEQMFFGCSKLKNLPQFNMSGVTVLASFLGNTSGTVAGQLTDASLNNLLASLTSAIYYTGTKTLYYIFGNRSMQQIYPASRIEGLSNYQAFVNAGWSIGWS